MNRLRALDGLRGLAILMVLAGHAAANYQPLAPATRAWIESFANPQQGVRIFFALSGYLITRLLLLEIASTGRIDLAAFWRRRALRIFPAYYVFLAVIAAWGLANAGALSWPHWMSAATFTWNYGMPVLPPTDRDLWVLGHTWSLAVEAQFYLFWPPLLAILGPRRGLWFLLGALALEPLVRVGSYAAFPGLRGYLVMMLHTGADGILAGCAAALLLQKPRLVAALQSHGRILSALAFLWIFALGPVCIHSIRGFSIVAGLTLDALAAAVIVAWLHHSSDNPLKRAFENGPLRWLGLISYSLYLWQQVFLHPALGLRESHLARPLLGALALGTMSYILLERPFASRRRPLATASSP